MTKTIAQLWNGNLEPIQHFGESNKELKNLEKLIQHNLEKLEMLLNGNPKDVFERYNDCINEYTDVLVEQAFCDGFCLGTKILAEALAGAEQLEKSPFVP